MHQWELATLEAAGGVRRSELIFITDFFKHRGLLSELVLPGSGPVPLSWIHTGPVQGKQPAQCEQQLTTPTQTYNFIF